MAKILGNGLCHSDPRHLNYWPYGTKSDRQKPLIKKLIYIDRLPHKVRHYFELFLYREKSSMSMKLIPKSGHRTQDLWSLKQ